MKSIVSTIWILGALLVIATLDALPDPPAVNPSTALCKVVRLHDCSSDSAPPPRCDFLGTSCPFCVSMVTPDSFRAYRPIDRIIRAGQAADPSPPTRQV